MISESVRNKAKLIELLILDVDGVLTDGRLWFTPSGEELKSFDIHDGYGLKRLQQSGIHVAVISGRESPALKIRLNELGIPHQFLGHEEKLSPYQQLQNHLKLTNEQIAYMGDDIPDMAVMQKAGLSIAVANAVSEVKNIADWQTRKKGGHGAVREVCDFLISTRQT